PVLSRRKARDFGHRPFGSVAAVLGVDTQLTVGRRGSGHVGRQVQRYRAYESKVVIGMLSDQVHATRRAKNRGEGGAVSAAERSDHSLSGDRFAARWASSSMRPPNTTRQMPQYRLTLLSVSGARVLGAAMPIPSRMMPSNRKNQPEGTLRSSILHEPQIQN